MSILCLGGSFNPIHNGHLECARTVAHSKRFEKVLLIPSARPPHKPKSADLAGPDDRLAMCRLAAANDPLFEVDDLELRREGLSFTIDTVRELRRRGWQEVNWLIGADMLINLPGWHEPLALLREANLLVIARPGFSFYWPGLPEAFQTLRMHVVEAPLINISASEIRRHVAAGESIAEFVPEAVARYIHDHGLYK